MVRKIRVLLVAALTVLVCFSMSSFLALTAIIRPSAKDIPPKSLIIGTYIIYLDSLTNPIYNIAAESGKTSDQFFIYYKSELSGGTQWYDISTAVSLSDIDDGGIKVDDATIDALILTHWVKQDRKTYDLDSGKVVDLLDSQDVWNPISMSELTTVVDLYQNGSELEKKAAQYLMPSLNKKQADLGEPTHIPAVKKEEQEYDVLEDFFVEEQIINQFEEQRKAMSHFYSYLVSRKTEEQKLLLAEELKNDIYIDMKITAYHKISDRISYLSEKLEQLSQEGDISRYTTIMQTLTNDISQTIASLPSQKSQSADVTNMLTKFMNDAKMNIVKHAQSGNHAAAEKALDDYYYLRAIYQSEIKNEERELLLDREVIDAAMNDFFADIEIGESDNYQKAVEQGYYEATLSDIRQEDMQKLKTKEKHIEFLIEAEKQRCKENSQENKLLSDRLKQALSYLNHFPQDTYYSLNYEVYETLLYYLGYAISDVTDITQPNTQNQTTTIEEEPQNNTTSPSISNNDNSTNVDTPHNTGENNDTNTNIDNPTIGGDASDTSSADTQPGKKEQNNHQNRQNQADISQLIEKPAISIEEPLTPGQSISTIKTGTGKEEKINVLPVIAKDGTTQKLPAQPVKNTDGSPKKNSQGENVYQIVPNGQPIPTIDGKVILDEENKPVIAKNVPDTILVNSDGTTPKNSSIEQNANENFNQLQKEKAKAQQAVEEALNTKNAEKAFDAFKELAQIEAQLKKTSDFVDDATLQASTAIDQIVDLVEKSTNGAIQANDLAMIKNQVNTLAQLAPLIPEQAAQAGKEIEKLLEQAVQSNPLIADNLTQPLETVQFIADGNIEAIFLDEEDEIILPWNESAIPESLYTVMEFAQAQLKNSRTKTLVKALILISASETKRYPQEQVDAVTKDMIQYSYQYPFYGTFAIPITKGAQQYYPADIMCESIGMRYLWEETRKDATIVNGENFDRYVEGNNQYLHNGTKSIPLDFIIPFQLQVCYFTERFMKETYGASKKFLPNSNYCVIYDESILKQAEDIVKAVIGE